MVKTCIGCGLAKEVTEFHKQKKQPDGLRPRCKECRRTESRAWYDANQETIKARSAKWRADNHVQYLKQLRSWAQRHPDRKRKSTKAWYKRNRERVIKQQLVYQKAHPEKTKYQTARRRAQINATIHRITHAEWQALKDRYEGCCAYCGKEEPNPTMDHVVPLKKGGGHTVDNIVPACGPCNRAKSTMSVMEFLALRQQGA